MLPLESCNSSCRCCGTHMYGQQRSCNGSPSQHAQSERCYCSYSNSDCLSLQFVCCHGVHMAHDASMEASAYLDCSGVGSRESIALLDQQQTLVQEVSHECSYVLQSRLQKHPTPHPSTGAKATSASASPSADERPHIPTSTGWQCAVLVCAATDSQQQSCSIWS